MRADAFYLKGLLDHLDVRPEVVRIGSHKTAGETLVREGMSDAQREQVEALATVSTALQTEAARRRR